MILFPMISLIDFIGSAHRELDQPMVLWPQKGSHTLLSPCCSGKEQNHDGSVADSTYFLLLDALGKEIKDPSNSPSSLLS